MSDSGPAIALVLENEGCGYQENDFGRGPSKYGITLLTLQETTPNATASDIYNLDPVSAAGFYQVNFWAKYGFYNIDNQDVANKVMDLAVLDGPETSIKWLQNAVGSKPDGILGPDTLSKLRATDPALVLERIRSQAGSHYLQVVYENPAKQKELHGWLARLEK